MKNIKIGGKKMNILLYLSCSFVLGFIFTIGLLWWLIVPNNNVICNIDGHVKFVPMKEIKISKKFMEQQNEI